MSYLSEFLIDDINCKYDTIKNITDHLGRIIYVWESKENTNDSNNSIIVCGVYNSSEFKSQKLPGSNNYLNFHSPVISSDNHGNYLIVARYELTQSISSVSSTISSSGLMFWKSVNGIDWHSSGIYRTDNQTHIFDSLIVDGFMEDKIRDNVLSPSKWIIFTGFTSHNEINYIMFDKKISRKEIINNSSVSHNYLSHIGMHDHVKDLNLKSHNNKLYCSYTMKSPTVNKLKIYFTIFDIQIDKLIHQSSTNVNRLNFDLNDENTNDNLIDCWESQFSFIENKIVLLWKTQHDRKIQYHYSTSLNGTDWEKEKRIQRIHTSDIFISHNGSNLPIPIIYVSYENRKLYYNIFQNEWIGENILLSLDTCRIISVNYTEITLVSDDKLIVITLKSNADFVKKDEMHIVDKKDIDEIRNDVKYNNINNQINSINSDINYNHMRNNTFTPFITTQNTVPMQMFDSEGPIKSKRFVNQIDSYSNVQVN